LFFLFLLVFSVYAHISKAEELKTVKGKQVIWKKDGAKMVYIPSNPDGTKNREPIYDEFGDKTGKFIGWTDDFYMDAYEVTVGQFKTFLKSSGYKPKKDIDWNELYKYSPTDDHPMIYVTWHDAVAYATWASKRLPTEKEWEFAARGGLIDKEYSWGNDESLARDYANYEGTGGKDKWQHTSPVGSFKPNGYGLYDMAGNLWEWCQDWYDNYQECRVLRGGCWLNVSAYLRLAGRDCHLSDWYDYGGGFRCVLGSN